MRDFLLIDVSNTFTKAVRVNGRTWGRLWKAPTASLDADSLASLARPHSPELVVFCCVVPAMADVVRMVFPSAVSIDHLSPLGVPLDYPEPASIGADRLANTAGCLALGFHSAIAVDFGTAITFDVLHPRRGFVGGVIAPGSRLLAEALHLRTAQLPLVDCRPPRHALGRSTRQAIASGVGFGAVGMVREILDRLRREVFNGEPHTLIATGGDARFFSRQVAVFDRIDPRLTLRGLLHIARQSTLCPTRIL